MTGAEDRLPREFWALFVISIVGWAGRLVLPFLTLYMTVEQRYTVGQAGLIMSLFGLGGFIAVLVAGPLMDRFGVYGVLLLSLAGTGVCAGALAASPSRSAVSVLLLLLGVFSFCMPSAVNTMITDLVTPTQWRRAFSYQYIGLNIGFAIGPLLAGILVDLAYSLLFVAEAACMCLSIVVVILFLRRRPRGVSEDRSPDAVPVSADVDGRFPPRRRVYRDYSFLLFIVLNIVFMAVFMQTQITLPIIMQGQGFTATQYGLVLTLNGLFVMTLQLPLDRLTWKVPYPKLLVVGTVLLIVGYTVHVFAAQLWVYMLAMCLWSLAEMFNIPIATTLTSMFATKKTVGSYQAYFTSTNPLSSLLGPLFGGILLESIGAQEFWIACCVLLTVVLIARQLSVPRLIRRFGHY